MRWVFISQFLFKEKYNFSQRNGVWNHPTITAQCIKVNDEELVIYDYFLGSILFKEYSTSIFNYQPWVQYEKYFIVPNENVCLSGCTWTAAFFRYYSRIFVSHFCVWNKSISFQWCFILLQKWNTVHKNYYIKV